MMLAFKIKLWISVMNEMNSNTSSLPPCAQQLITGWIEIVVPVVMEM